MNSKMITINLLTKEKINALREYLLIVAFHDFAAFSFILVSFIAMILLMAYVALTNTFNATIEQSTFVTKEYGGMNSLIRRVNTKLTTLNSIEKEFTPWSEIMVSASVLVPKNVSLVTFSADKSSREVIIRGVAVSREDLLSFMKALTDSGLFENIESPISNLLSKTDLAFDLKMKIVESAVKTVK